MASLILLFLTSGCETCIVESWLPEFKGTYDEGQDELLAIDWSADAERQQMMDEIDVANSMSSRRHIPSFDNKYNKRLSDLKMIYQELLHKHHIKFMVGKQRNYQQVAIEVPKTCSVCFESFEASSEVIGLDCNPFRHVFHWKCMISWLKRQRSCPLCRKSILYLLPRSIF